jgi:DNA polymerase/3'-5' exonuclease PolX
MACENAQLWQAQTRIGPIERGVLPKSRIRVNIESSRVERQPLGYSPAFERAVKFQPEIKMQRSGAMLATAGKLAIELQDLLDPACERIEIAGSVRRNWSKRFDEAGSKEIVNDLELVCIPKPDKDPKKLVSEVGDGCAVENLLARWRHENSIKPDPDVSRDGPLYKRFIWRELCLVDLFIVRPPRCWGVILTVRTGDKDFTRTLVTSRAQGGAMPAHLRCHEGHLCRVASHEGDPKSACGKACMITVETEAAFFSELGIPFVPPERRNEAELLSILKGQRRAPHHAGSVA